MPRRSSRAIYEARMHRVLEHIDAHLEQPLDLDALAAVAAFSQFHFHRLFAAWMGERAGDFVRRRRLEVAASRLVAQPALGVLEVALAVGFGSAEAFARAFKVHFGCSPTAWRRGGFAQRQLENRKLDQTRGRLDQAAAAACGDDGRPSLPDRPEPHMPNVRLETLEPVHLAYLRYTGPYGEPVSHFWQDQVAPWMASNSLLGNPRYGISHDDPSITAPARCRYDACVEVAAGAVLSGAPQRTMLPGGRYAVLAFNGTVEEVGEAWSALLRDWLPGSGLQLDGRPCFEHYPADAAYDPKTGRFGCRICVPVAPL